MAMLNNQRVIIMTEICIPDFPAQVDQDVPREPRCLAAFPAESAGCIDSLMDIPRNETWLAGNSRTKRAV